MSKPIALIIAFMLLIPQLTFAQLAGTNGKYSCDYNNKGKKTVYLHRRTNQFVTNRRPVKRKAALNDMLQIRRSQSRVIRETVQLNRILRKKSEGHSPTLPVSQFFNKSQRKIFNGLMKTAPRTEHLLSTPTTLNSSVEAVLANFVEIVSNQQKVHTDHFVARKILKNCKGCETGDEVTDSFTFRRRRRARKCSCFTKTVPATLQWYFGNNPSSPNNCKAFGLTRWSATETRNAVSVEAFYTWTESGPSLRSKSGTPPYHDVYAFYDTEIIVGEGQHQLLLAHGSKSHGNPSIVVSCADMSARQQQAVINPYIEARICPLGKED